MELYKFEYKMHLFCLHTYIHTYCLFSQKPQYGTEMNCHIDIMKVKKVLLRVKK